MDIRAVVAIGNIPQNEKPPLPHQLNYEKAISDYLHELVISIPAEFDDRAKDTIRKCLYNAELTNSKESKKVEFTTEPEAAAVYCMRNLKGQNEMIPVNASFMVVDCGGGTYCKDDIKEKMEDNDWIIDIKFEDLKSMFDPVVGKIIRLIRGQLDSSKDKCSAIFLVGGFSESKYLQMRVKKEFGKLVSAIIVPKQPIAAIVRGACDYGLEMSTIVDRTLKYTYGIEANRDWIFGDPIDRKENVKGNDEPQIEIFDQIVTRSTNVVVNQEFSKTYIPSSPDYTSLAFKIYKTTELSAEFCDEPGMELLGTLTIALPDVHLGKSRRIEFSLMFGKMEIVASAKNLQNGRSYDTSFDLDFKS
ncbi:hypothetical protein RhiirB3_451101 [Rhizophagus irregularis]|nr:hypothetical protein RhiirB3_451101 [Rhizophagus irregularis]